MDDKKRETAKLPPYQAVLLVDVKDFSGMPGREHPEVSAAIPGILGRTFERCDLSYVWSSQRYWEGLGDGYAATFPPEFLPYLLNPFLGALQAELDYRSDVRALPQDLRMRVNVHVGPVTHVPGDQLRSGTGPTRVESQRLVDCEQVKNLLTQSDSVTKVAAVISQRVYEDAVATGYAAEAPGLYRPVQVTQKSYSGTAYLRVPVPSGGLLDNGFGTAEQASAATEQVARSAPATRNAYNHFSGGTAGTVVQTGFVEGGVNTGEQHTQHVGRDNYQNSGSGNQFNRSHVDRYDDRRRP
ncbi:hypothetical protein KCV87_01715 [Actinosynnema pretiosum subsp. pretiosum]|uniref:Guanylate cyclase domain-containing protein n=1 Tax=Actinosynnema pretiosum subsp. pretiosum TaxID=103721 RepID=A0AA45R4Q5_9PSEU|nr:hypothetical protein KCV87_01715 [Actinosynnema pretiosum subsp. pretiosum]